MIIDRTSYLTAKENMDYDESLLLKAENYGGIWRVYRWKNQPSLTYPLNKGALIDTSLYDSASRVTGGGLVFHNPGDIMFTLIVPIFASFLPKGLKDKLAYVVRFILNVFQKKKIIFDSNYIPMNKQNIFFCNAYFSPYEKYLHGEKVLGIALKKYKKIIIFQGILHLFSNYDYFQAIACDYKIYFSKGLKNVVYNASELYEEMCNIRFS